ncbi:hypothetical protein AB0I22_23690 [Streptomyces sp. NPDC050610]|uniref:hypothetical protein n=1 Tax=Streptomyces sp. NPDC050610 TaxID=3157097 RepID=UPI00343AB445
MRSAAREALSRLMDELGADGVLLVLKLDESAARPDRRPPTGSIAFPPCDCAEHRAGRGKPDTAVRLSAKGDDGGDGDARGGGL